MSAGPSRISPYCVPGRGYRVPFRCGAAGEASRRAPYIWRLSVHKRVPTFDHSPCLNKHAAAHSLLARNNGGHYRPCSAVGRTANGARCPWLEVFDIDGIRGPAWRRHGWNMKVLGQKSCTAGYAYYFVTAQIATHSQKDVHMYT